MPYIKTNSRFGNDLNLNDTNIPKTISETASILQEIRKSFKNGNILI